MGALTAVGYSRLKCDGCFGLVLGRLGSGYHRSGGRRRKGERRWKGKTEAVEYCCSAKDEMAKWKEEEEEAHLAVTGRRVTFRG